MILHLDVSDGWRGGQTQLAHLLRAGGALATCEGSAIGDWAETQRLPVHRLPRPLWRAVPAFRWLVRGLGPELVAAHTSHAHQLAWLAGIRPLVVHRRVDFPPSRMSTRKYRWPDGYVAVSGAVRGVLARAGVDPARIAVVHDGIAFSFPAPAARATVRTELGVGDGELLAVSVGALVRHKDHATLVDAAAALARRHPGVKLRWVVAGEGPERKKLERQIHASKLGNVFRLLGQRDDVPALLAAADLFVHPSREEGFGQAVVEAMASGLPIVATQAGGIPEALGAGTAWLVPPASAEALATAMAEAVADPESRSRYAEAARVAARGFHADAMVRATFAAYHALVGRERCDDR